MSQVEGLPHECPEDAPEDTHEMRLGSTSLAGGCRAAGVRGKDPDLHSLQEALIYGIKGVAVYYCHAYELGYKDEEIGFFLSKALYSTLTNVNFNKGSFLEMILETGKMQLKAMELLDKAYAETFGAPTPVEVPTGTEEGHGILVTGHSYKPLYELLKQIREMGPEDEVEVYTHSEMLLAHSYPGIRGFKALYGNWGAGSTRRRSSASSPASSWVRLTVCYSPASITPTGCTQQVSRAWRAYPT